MKRHIIGQNVTKNQNLPLFRLAKPGDYFLIFVPAEKELARIDCLLEQFKNEFGGTPVQLPHLTCQRFSCEFHDEQRILYGLEKTLCGNPFQVSAESYAIATSTLDRQRCSLSLTIDQNSPWYAFRDQVNQSLESLGISPHYPDFINGHVTLLRMVKMKHLELPFAELFPIPLFLAQTLSISRMNEDNDFDIVSSFQIQPCSGFFSKH